MWAIPCLPVAHFQTNPSQFGTVAAASSAYGCKSLFHLLKLLWQKLEGWKLEDLEHSRNMKPRNSTNQRLKDKTQIKAWPKTYWFRLWYQHQCAVVMPKILRWECCQSLPHILDAGVFAFLKLQAATAGSKCQVKSVYFPAPAIPMHSYVLIIIMIDR